MTKNILVYQELISKIPVLRREARALGANILVVTGGKDALEKALKLKPGVVLLSDTMPQMSGEDTYLALVQAIPDIKAYIICKNPAQAASADFLSQYPESIVALPYAQKTVGEHVIPELGGVLAEYLKNDLSEPKDVVDQRLATKQFSHGYLTFEVGGERHKAVILTLSRNGILFSSQVEVPVGEELPLEMTAPTGTKLNLSAQVVKIKKNEETESAAFSLGARFLEVLPQQLEQLDLWIASLRSVHNQVPVEGKNSEHADATDVSGNKSVDEAEEKVELFQGGSRLDAEVITISMQWILFECDKNLTENDVVELKFTSSQGHVPIVSAQVVKVQQKKDGVFRIGAKYVFSQEDEKKIAQAWMAKFGAMLSKEVPAPDAKFVQKILTGRREDLLGLIVSHPFDPRLRFVGILNSMETRALRSLDPASVCLQKLILLRAQCGLFYDFLPTIQSNAKVIGDAFLKILSSLLLEIDGIERETESEVRRAVAESNNDLRVQFNSSSNKLHQIKGRMILAVLERLQGTPLSEHPVYSDVEQRAELLNSVQVVEDLKYKRKKEVKKAEIKKKKKKFKVNRNIKIGMTIALFTIFAAIIFKVKTGYVSVGSLNLEFPLIKVVAKEDGVDLFCDPVQWDRLREEDKNQTMENIEKYLTKEHLKQAKLMDEQGKLLAATAVVERPVGKDPVYKRRMKGSKSF